MAGWLEGWWRAREPDTLVLVVEITAGRELLDIVEMDPGLRPSHRVVKAV